MNAPPPQSIEIEQSVLSSCLLYQDIARDAAEMLIDDDFYRTAHKKIFQAVKAVLADGGAPNIISVSESMRAKKILAESGGATYLASLLNVPVVGNISHYADKLREKRALREMIIACQSAIQECFSANGNAQEAIEGARRSVSSVGMDSCGPAYCKMADLTVQSIERYEEMSRLQRPPGIMTGFPTIDYLTGGFRGPRLIIIAARPSVGKTAMMCNMVAHMARSGVTCGIFELEMPKEEIDDRWMSQLTGINSVRLATGHNITEGEWRMITDRAAQKSEWPVMIDDSGGLTAAEIKRRAKQMHRDGAEIIFIDQLSKIRGDYRKSDWEVNTQHVQELDWLKKELGIPIVLLAQINRSANENSVKRPMLHHLKSTGRLEEDADIVLIGHRDYVYTKADADEHTAVWDLAKHRGGPTRFIEMFWDGKLTKFYEMERRF